MIDVEFVQNQCETAIKNGYGHLPVIECGNAVKINELITRLREAEKDAARYRWIKENVSSDEADFILSMDVCCWDAAISEAMKCK